MAHLRDRHVPSLVGKREQYRQTAGERRHEIGVLAESRNGVGGDRVGVGKRWRERGSGGGFQFSGRCFARGFH
jgi:hypothetical protein